MVGKNGDGDRFVPTLSAAEVERIRQWHERAYAGGRAEGRSELTFAYLGSTIVVPPEVMPITPLSHLLGEAVIAEVNHGDRVLDMGTGSGVNAVLAARAGGQVVAVDTNPVAVEAARANADRNGVGDRVDVRMSDVFASIDEAFDLIVFDPPFRWFRPRDLFETAMADEGYRAMRIFFRQARSHLVPSGRMLIFFGTSGDLGYLHRVMAHNGFTWTVVATDATTRDGVEVEYFTFRVTAATA